MIRSYLLHGCAAILTFKSYRRTRRKLSSSVQFENENDVIPSAINMNRSRSTIF